MVSPVRPHAYPLHTALLMMVAVGLAGCPAEMELTGPAPLPKPSPTGTPGMGGGVTEDTAGPAVPTPPVWTPDPRTPSPTPLPTAAPLISVTSFSLTPATKILFRPPQDPGLSLGYDSHFKFVAEVTRSDESAGGVRWQILGGAPLRVDAHGLVSVEAQAAPGTYFVRAWSVDDPRLFQDAAIEVRAIGQLDVTID